MDASLRLKLYFTFLYLECFLILTRYKVFLLSWSKEGVVLDLLAFLGHMVSNGISADTPSEGPIASKGNSAGTGWISRQIGWPYYQIGWSYYRCTGGSASNSQLPRGAFIQRGGHSMTGV